MSCCFLSSYTQHTLDFNSADIPNASGCLSSPDFIRTAQLVQHPARKRVNKRKASCFMSLDSKSYVDHNVQIYY